MRNVKLATLMLAAGFALSVSAQTQPASPNSEQARTSVRTATGVHEFGSCHKLSGKSVRNGQGETIAEVTDFIVDRGSGRIEFAVIKAGSVLGIGGKTLAIPYGAFGWNHEKEDFVLDSSVEQLKQHPEFTPESWSGMMESKAKAKANALRDKLSEEGSWSKDPYAGKLEGAESVTVQGEVTDVDRKRASDGSENVIVTVKTTDGTKQKVVFGPSWYVGGGTPTPVRGDTLVVHALRLPRDPDKVYVGTGFSRDGQERRLRGADNVPVWISESVENDGKRADTAYWRYALVSNLKGMRVDCRGEECGKVNDVIVERGSGEIAFLSIDPNKNFLGIADTKRLVPWSIATVALDGTVRLDASKEMILASAETPKDLSELNTVARSELVYRAYGVPPSRFDRADRRIVATPNRDMWSANGPVFVAMDKTSARTFDGTIANVGEVQLGDGVPAAKSIKVKTGNEHYEILVGPNWYMENQQVRFDKGDTVKVEACRTTINGTPYWIAQSISSNGRKVVLIDEGGPAWDDR